MVNKEVKTMIKSCSFSLIIFFFFPSLFISQQDTLLYRITFLDKDFNSFNINNPIQFLSQRAIERRAKFNIPIEVNDLPLSKMYLDSISKFSEITIINKSKWLNSIVISCYDTNAITTISNWSFVSNIFQAKSNTIVKYDKFQNLFSDEKEEIVVNEHFPYGITYNQNHLHKIDYLHDIGFQGQGMHIAVIDAGFENANQLQALSKVFEEGRILSVKDFVAHDGEVFNDHSHGTAVLSVIAGYIEGEFFGTAPKASFHLLRSEDANAEYILEEDFWVSAAEYADSAGVDIINTSLSYTTFDDSTQNHTFADLDGNTTVIAKGSNIAASKGILLCSSAGNYGEAIWGRIGTPADASNVLTIAAVDSIGIRAGFSSRGPNASVEVKPNVASVGHNCYLVAPWDGTIIRANGTSFSAPMISGMVACLWQALPKLSQSELRNLIQENSSQFAQPDSLLGYGIPDFYKAYQSVTGITYKLSEDLKILNVYPNPYSSGFSELQIMISSNIDQTIELTFIDALGKPIHQTQFSVASGQNKVSISNLPAFASSVYRLRFKDEKGDFYYQSLVIHN